jgi:RecA/RadA recombinase
MDYHAIHGYDRASFDTPGTRQSCNAPLDTELKLTLADRLPTISASQALDDLGCDASTRVSTGLEGLDRSLLGTVTVDSQDTAFRGGVQRGQVTEIWGPPGTGKTALG